MDIVPALFAWMALLLSALWFFLAAKVHGRQIRLERELRGYTEVSFGRAAQNPPWVEGLWRTDRIRFWPTLAVLAAAFALYVLAANARTWARPFTGFEAAFAAAIVALLWAPSLAFLSNGLQSVRRFERDVDAEGTPGPGGDRSAWLVQERRATLGYWAAATLLALVVVIVAFA